MRHSQVVPMAGLEPSGAESAANQNVWAVPALHGHNYRRKTSFPRAGLRSSAAALTRPFLEGNPYAL